MNASPKTNRPEKCKPIRRGDIRPALSLAVNGFLRCCCPCLRSSAEANKKTASEYGSGYIIILAVFFFILLNKFIECSLFEV